MHQCSLFPVLAVVRISLKNEKRAVDSARSSRKVQSQRWQLRANTATLRYERHALPATIRRPSNRSNNCGTTFWRQQQATTFPSLIVTTSHQQTEASAPSPILQPSYRATSTVGAPDSRRTERQRGAVWQKPLPRAFACGSRDPVPARWSASAACTSPWRPFFLGGPGPHRWSDHLEHTKDAGAAVSAQVARSGAGARWRFQSGMKHSPHEGRR